MTCLDLGALSSILTPLRSFAHPTCSVFVRDTSNCRITVICQQLRTRNTTDCEFHLYCMTKACIKIPQILA